MSKKSRKTVQPVVEEYKPETEAQSNDQNVYEYMSMEELLEVHEMLVNLCKNAESKSHTPSKLGEEIRKMFSR